MGIIFEYQSRGRIPFWYGCLDVIIAVVVSAATVYLVKYFGLL